MTQSEIMVKLGLDTTNFQQGLDKAKQQVANVAPDKAVAEKGGQSFGEWFGHAFNQKFMKLMKTLIVVQIISLMKDALKELFDWMSRELASIVFPAIDKSIMDANAAIADRFRKMRMDRQNAEKELADLQKEYIEKHLTAAQKVNERWKEVLEHARNINKAQDELKKHVRTHENIVKLAQERLALAKAQIAFEEASANKKKLDEEQAKKRADFLKKQQEAGRELAAPFTGPLTDINAKILQDMALLRQYDNAATRSNLMQDLARRRQIVDDIRRQVQDKTKPATPAEMLTQRIIDMLIERGAIKVNVVNAE